MDTEGCILNGYWRLYAKIFGIKICRKCGVVLSQDFRRHKRGFLCDKCYSQRDVIRGLTFVVV